MIRRLIILLLIVGCVFADTIKYQNLMGDILIINNVEYAGIEGDMVYYILNNEKSQIYCPRILEITDVGGWQIEFECAKTKQLFTPSSKPSIESNSISKRKLKQAGNNLERNIIQVFGVQYLGMLSHYMVLLKTKAI